MRVPAALLPTRLQSPPGAKPLVSMMMYWPLLGKVLWASLDSVLKSHLNPPARLAMSENPTWHDKPCESFCGG